MNKQPVSFIQCEIPQWLVDFESTVSSRLPESMDDADWMDLAIGAARKNIQEKTGGPFGALVVDECNCALISLGVNLVPSGKMSWLHAEMVAISLAQQQFQAYDLSGKNLTLYSSVEPCAMCLGAIPWSGIRRVVCGASDASARAVGFDEGCKPAPWQLALQRAGIEVVTGVCAQQAADVLTEWASSHGENYHP